MSLPPVTKGIEYFELADAKVELHTRTRKRDVSILKDILHGNEADSVCLKHAVSESSCKAIIVRMMQILWFRAQDRKGVKNPPSGMRDIRKDRSFWLEMFNENETALYALTPPK